MFLVTGYGRATQKSAAVQQQLLQMIVPGEKHATVDGYGAAGRVGVLSVVKPQAACATVRPAPARPLPPSRG